eukprot:TRINITY_DN1871_c0_g1_i1.p2 TRINITY_DN1871_c0_g1~~TRINITY_DN1871_c0_g1_i1.p2  ORF type:complete len:132 (+),score=16.47 TRINITY_DN1871_c0_g1_i1:189-584(+)
MYYILFTECKIMIESFFFLIIFLSLRPIYIVNIMSYLIKGIQTKLLMENLKNVAPVEDFNWDAYENGEAFIGASQEELEKAYDSTLNKVNDREVVDGTVISMNKREVVVNIGYKSDGIIPLNEFRLSLIHI